MKILSSINFPSDLKKLSISDLMILCKEIREEIIRITYKNGGHLGSNLGAIELTVALHYVFNSPIDKIMFDVGHQSYTHKILTGRRDIIENLRTEFGASGFLDPEESEHDCFISGHVANAISVSLGMAKARDLSNKSNMVISVIGDGALSNGMTYEAFNNMESIKNFIIVLNDNQMSISKTVGMMNVYLNKLLSSRNMLIFRQKIRYLLDKLPKKLSVFLEKIIKKILFTFKDRTIFEDFGIGYVGPIDGHNIELLIETFKNVKNYRNYKPIIIHTVTNKGNGYGPAEKDIYKLHGVSNTKSLEDTYTDVFSNEIVRLAETNEKIICITAAMESGCGLSLFAKKFPDRFFDVGIAEAHAVTFAAGLAKEGYSPFVCMYSSFLQRAFDQVYHDVVLLNLPVRFIVDKAGLPGKDGKTHSGIYDISMLSMFENFQIFAPSCKTDLVNSLKFSASYNDGPLAIRFPKLVAGENIENKEIESDVLVLQVGNISLPIEDADIMYICKIQPFDYRVFLEKANKYKKVFIVEEGIYGGFSSLLLEFLTKNGHFKILKKIKIINIPKSPVFHDSVEKQKLKILEKELF